MMNAKVKKILMKCYPKTIISNSKYFNKEWYSKTYNVSQNKCALHFLNEGYSKGYNPSDFFDCKLYEKANPDISNINPLLHWECYGMYENRNIVPSKKFRELDNFYERLESDGAILYDCPTSIYDNTKLVLVFSHQMDLTGAPIALLNTVKQMKDMGFYPIIISPTDGDLTKLALNSNIPVLIYKNLANSTLLDGFYTLFDLVFVNTLSFYYLINKLNGTNAKVIWWIHECKLFYEQVGNLLESLPQELEDNISIYAVGDYAKKQLLEFRPKYNIGDLLYYLPDDEAYDTGTVFGFEDEDKTIFACVGSLEQRKGYEILLQSLKMVDSSIKNKIKVVFVGGKQDEHIYELVKDFKDEIELVYIEKISRELMPSFYKKINCLICASTDDPMPIVVTEAWKYSVPVICSESAGSAKFIEEYNGGILYENDDPVNLANAINKFVSNEHNQIVENGLKIYSDLFDGEVFQKRLFRIINYVINKKSVFTYKQWYNKTKASKEELERQRNEEIKETDPKFSVLVPLYNTPLNFLDEMIESVIDQTYGKWELCLADGSDEAHVDEVSKEVNKYQDKDTRVLYKRLEKNEGISGNTNEALKMATGDFIVLFDHDDLLTEDALYEFAKAIREDEEVDCIYSDEDKVDENTENYYEPHFKPDYNIDLLCSTNYICHLFAVRKTLTDKYGGFRSEYDGSQDHDFILRMTEQARKTAHVAKILYHWRVHSNSTAQNPENKMYCFTSGQKAVKAHYERVWPNIKIDKVDNGAYLGAYHIQTHFDEYPLISVIIPNKDHTEDLDKAIRSMIEKGTWPNLEFIVVENNSEKEETFTYYKKIQKEFDNVKVVMYDGDFNYSRINNFGVKYASGEYYLLMNNDVELIEPDSMKEMMGYCQREDVGIVGCRLLYKDNTIQHAGVIIGISGVAGHSFKGLDSSKTYFGRAMLAQDYSAVTAAVLLTKKSVYEAVNGLDETFAVAFNDIDFCMRVRKLDKLVVYNPYACFYHYESKSRGLDIEPEKQKRFNHEIALFIDRYNDFLNKGDNYYNQNLTLVRDDFSLKDLSVEKIGEQFYSKEQIEVLKSYL